MQLHTSNYGTQPNRTVRRLPPGMQDYLENIQMTYGLSVYY
jgi:hypothetical protein